MPKIRHTSAKGLIQETGSGVTLEQGQVVRTISSVTATVDTVSGTTSTDTGITLAAGGRVLAWKVEVLAITLGGGGQNPAGSIADIGFKGGDTDAIADGFGLTAATVGGSAAGFALNTEGARGSATGAGTPATEIAIVHTDPANDASSKLRLTLLTETYA